MRELGFPSKIRAQQMASPTSNHPWWARQLDAVTKRSVLYLRRHFPGIANAHDDIASEAKTQLAEQIVRDERDYPRSWYEAGPSEDSSEHDYFFQLAQTILRRRIADHFREKSLAWARDVDIDSIPEESLSENRQSDERRATLEKMLKLSIQFMATLPPEDRLLVARLAEGAGADKIPYTAAERQRVHRMRKKLADQMREQLGESVTSLLRDE